VRPPRENGRGARSSGNPAPPRPTSSFAADLIVDAVRDFADEVSAERREWIKLTAALIAELQRAYRIIERLNAERDGQA
jgi:hypothetical protein